MRTQKLYYNSTRGREYEGTLTTLGPFFSWKGAHFRSIGLGNFNKTYLWIGQPYWGGLLIQKPDYSYTIHLQALLCCLGINWKTRFHWFKDSWRALLLVGRQ